MINDRRRRTPVRHRRARPPVLTGYLWTENSEKNENQLSAGFKRVSKVTYTPSRGVYF